MKKEELLKSREYWIAKIQTDLYHMLEDYRTKKGITKTELAAELGFTKGYITQILSGDFDHKISKLVDLSLAVGKAPELNFTDLKQVIGADEEKCRGRVIDLKTRFKSLQTGKTVRLTSGTFSTKSPVVSRYQRAI